MSISINGDVATFNTAATKIDSVRRHVLKTRDNATCIHQFDCHSLKAPGIFEMLTYVTLKVSVHFVAMTLIPTMFVRFEPVWVNYNTRAHRLERMLRGIGHGLNADQLD